MLSVCGCKLDICRVWAFPPRSSWIFQSRSFRCFFLGHGNRFYSLFILAQQSSAKTFWIDVSAPSPRPCCFSVLGCRFFFHVNLSGTTVQFFLKSQTYWSWKFVLHAVRFILLYSALKQILKCCSFFCPCMLHDLHSVHNLLGFLSLRWNCFHSSIFYLSQFLFLNVLLLVLTNVLFHLHAIPFCAPRYFKTTSKDTSK